MRPGIHQLAGSGATAGKVPVWNAVTQEWEPGDAPDAALTLYDAKGDLLIGTANDARARLAVGADGQVLTADSTQPTGVKWAAPTSGGGSLTVQDENGTVATGVTQIDFQGAGVTAAAGTGEVVVTIPGGSGGGTVKDRRWTVPSGATSIDEFNDDSLDAAWVRVDGANAPAANVTWAEGGDTLSAKQTLVDTGNALHGLMRPIGTSMAVGDAFITALRIFGKSGVAYSISGLVLADGVTYGSGTQLATECYYDSTGPNYNWATNLYTGYTSSSSGTTTDQHIGGPTFVRLVRLGTTSWRGDRSPDGVQWFLGPTFTATITPTYVGLFTRKPGSGVQHITTFEFLRRVSGVS